MLRVYRSFPEYIAEEATAEAMTRLFSNWGKVALPQAWVRTVAFHVACQMAKGQLMTLPDQDFADAAAADHLAAVETALVAGQTIGSLPPMQKAVAELALADLTPSEMAEVLGCTPEQARGNLAHARRALKRVIQAEEGS
jgi:RNA polymerase sigma-70 factor (ECF subfamily)